MRRRVSSTAKRASLRSLSTETLSRSAEQQGTRAAVRNGVFRYCLGMRYPALLFVVSFSLTVQSQAQSPSPACTTATSACTEWVTLGSGPARSLIYRSLSLDARNQAIRRALI